MGVGAATLISMRLGQRDYDTARRVLGNVVVLNAIIGVAFAAVVLAFLDPILYFFGGSEATVGYAHEYMTIILLGNVVTHMYLGLNAVLRASGHPQQSMYATINTVIINTVLDALFIYGFGWGIRGAAIATVLAQVVSLAWQFRILSDKRELLHFSRGIYRLKKRIVRDIMAIGMSPFLMNLAACFIVILNKQRAATLRRRPDDRRLRHRQPPGILLRDDCHGRQPRHAAHRGLQLRRTPIRTGAARTAADDHGRHVHHDHGISYRRTGAGSGRLAVHDRRRTDPPFGHGNAARIRVLPHHRVPDVATNFFQSIGMAGKAVFLSLSRQLLFLVPGLLLLPGFFDAATPWNGSWGVWCAMPLSDLLAAVVTFFMLTAQLRKFRAMMAQPQNAE